MSINAHLPDLVTRTILTKLAEPELAEVLPLLTPCFVAEVYAPFPDELLFLGSKFGKLELVRNALTNGAFCINTALMFASANARHDVIRYLLDVGAGGLDRSLSVSTDSSVTQLLRRHGASAENTYQQRSDFILTEGPEGILSKRTVASIA